MLGVGALECGGSELLQDTILARDGIRGYAYEAHLREAFDACAKTPFNIFAYLGCISEYLKIIAMAKQAADFYITSCDEGDAYHVTKARSLERARTDFLIIVSNI
ncbi:uncharacterized protein BBA_01130 [Beauveria bassiana ARSEF 2860]|uniref:Uncharacterized protein n=1 Tax=Beauveria bassiana (strain ARSEF 2860) TaxID=655819 RepID=J5K838_BEAB2|nr:uncharacterized protein BBA_01130 [Beauveria bassiana ARSEF 2860]EJP70261.1 hypothetical protein BBA_01130 [Beauveria bassiana ARSEF 2860]